jgi:hypothetical protein
MMGDDEWWHSDDGGSWVRAATTLYCQKRKMRRFTLPLGGGYENGQPGGCWGGSEDMCLS